MIHKGTGHWERPHDENDIGKWISDGPLCGATEWRTTSADFVAVDCPECKSTPDYRRWIEVERRICRKYNMVDLWNESYPEHQI